MSYFNQETNRLQFRKLRASDVDNWIEFFENNDRIHFMGFTDRTKSNYSLAKEWIEMQLERYENCGLGLLAAIDTSSHELVGLAGLVPRYLFNGTEYEVVYSLKQRHWGKGYGTEMALKMKEFGIKHHIASRFISIIHVQNTPSMNVAIKNGMKIVHQMEYQDMNVFVFGIGSFPAAMFQ
jgi:[ribosomal protein S5]-alanine N-acetyltransferase